MSNGPPTPPDSAQDVLNSDAPSSPAATAPPAVAQPSTTAHQMFFPDLASLAIQGKFQELATQAEIADLYPGHENHQNRLLIITPLVLAYLILDDLPPARDALMRLPDSLAGNPLPQALFSLLASTWNRRHERVYSRADDIVLLVGKGGFFDAQLAVVVKGMAATFIDTFRQRTLTLISKAYTSLSLQLAQSYLGLPTDQLLNVSQRHNWVYDASSQTLTPTTSVSPASYSRGRLDGLLSAPSSLATFDLVTNGVARLET